MQTDIKINAHNLALEYQHTALTSACALGHDKIVQLLLAREYINVNTTDYRRGRTALMWACENGHEGVVKLLLARGISTFMQERRMKG